MTDSRLQELLTAIIEGARDRARSAVTALAAAGIDPHVVLDSALLPAMEEVGRRFAEGVYFVPHVLLSARAMKEAMAVIQPSLAGAGPGTPGRVVVIGTVKDDLHDIGKNLVATMLQGGGFEVVDLGVDVSPERFLEAARSHRAAIVALSALLTTTMNAMASTVALVAGELGARTLVGGAPVTPAFCRSIGAHGYAAHAIGAVAEARRLMGQ